MSEQAKIEEVLDATKKWYKARRAIFKNAGLNNASKAHKDRWNALTDAEIKLALACQVLFPELGNEEQ